MKNERSITYQLIDERLTGDFATFVAERRAAGKSWNRIAFAIYDATRVEVTGASLRNWFGDAVTEASA